MGDAHCSSFGCHIAPSDVAPASLVSIGRFCVCAHPFVFILGWSLLLRWLCSLLVVMWLWLLCGVRWHVSGARWGLSGWKGQLLGTHKNDDNERQVVVHRIWLPCSFTSWGPCCMLGRVVLIVGGGRLVYVVGVMGDIIWWPHHCGRRGTWWALIHPVMWGRRFVLEW